MHKERGTRGIAAGARTSPVAGSAKGQGLKEVALPVTVLREVE